ncbi:MAG: N-6 DNA methylase, partial [Treponema sp.]|nr:N-6 DNA methylase [Treponema sp.]
MKLSWEEIQANAVKFSKRWQDAKNEEAQAQSFVTSLLQVFGVNDPEALGDFEFKVPLSDNKTGYIDYLWKGKIAIEMKSRGKDLSVAFRQLQIYMQHLELDDIPDLWLVCDFETIYICRRSNNENITFKTKDLRKHIRRFADIAGYETERIRETQKEVNVKAAEKMAKLHDALKSHGYEGHDLQVHLVRLLFCLFANDTGIFPKDALFRYLQNSKSDGSDLSDRIAKLYDILNLNEEVRKKRTLISEELKQFRYINGLLFSQVLPVVEFNAKMRQILFDCLTFEWSKISPAIFGAMFQGVMDKDQRRELGAHYTSEENILKLINPLFMDELWKEFDDIKTSPKGLDVFHDKISKLKFLDPACGCGNFLIITYRELRRLELEILKMKISSAQRELDISPMLKVNIEQFYGIEILDFPCQVAQVGMWLIDHQMNLLVSEQFGMYYARLPLTQSATIVPGNALRIDWESVVPKAELSYILGNPPFIGFTYMNNAQKADMELLFPKTKNLDYVSAWYMKAIDYIHNTNIECAFVSTNSICQGETLPVLWKKLLGKGAVINYAYRTFIWSNEAKGKAAVHCIIIGFALFNRKVKWIYEGELRKPAKNISPYLVDASNIIVESHSNAICDVPAMVYGNKPADGGNLIIELEDYNDFITREPKAIKYIRRIIGATEYINKKDRYCLWLVGANPAELRNMPLVMDRVEKCRKMRADSIASGIRKFAATPTIFAQVTQPEGADYIVVPRVSSERRRYIPIGFLTSDIITSDAVQLIPYAN